MFKPVSRLLTVISAVAMFPTLVSANELNIYSARHYDTDLAIYDKFTEETGIEINLIEGKSEELIARIGQEGEFSPADVLLTVDAGRLWHAVEADLFAPVENEVLESRIPAHLRHPDGLWFGISKRARVIITNRSAEIPTAISTYASLADPALDGKVCIRSSSNIYNISLMASVIEHEGAEAAEQWANGVVSNFARTPQGNDTAHLRAVASGECLVAIANTYYVGRLMASDKEEDKAVVKAIEVRFPNQETTGTHVNISGAGLMRHAPNRENAIRFLEFLAGDWAQRALADGNNEYPTVSEVEVSGPILALGGFKEDNVSADALGRNQAAAIRTFDKAGWR